MPELAQKMTDIIRKQMRACGSHHGLAPVLDILRDPRWGRVEETFGEDPTLISQMGMAYVRGLQGENLKTGVLATGKHYVAHSLPEGGLNCTPVHIGLRELRDSYLMPFEAVIREAGLATIMNSYSEMDGEVVATSHLILSEILRDELGFDGPVVSDYEAILMLNTFHRTASTLGEAASQAIQAGIDLELPQTLCYGQPLIEMVKAGKVSETVIDQAVARNLQKKFELGLFENPFVDEAILVSIFSSDEDLKTAKMIAEKSLVLLKNESGLLPLSQDIKTIAVIGPNADQGRCMMGDYSYPAGLEMFLDSHPVINAEMQNRGDFQDYQSLMDGIPTLLRSIHAKVTAKTKILFAKGCEINAQDRSGFAEAVEIAHQADVVILALGDKSGLVEDCTCGEFRDRTELNLPGIQEELVAALTQCGKPMVLVLINGRPFDLSGVVDKVNAILETWTPGEAGGTAIAEALFGVTNPGGKLTVSLPRSVGQVPIYYNHKPSGGHSHFRGEYVSEKTTPLFPFGHGLSYTRFKYSKLITSAKKVETNGTLEVSFTVQNTGKKAGDEVVQLYVRDEFASIPRPVKELKGFKRLTLQAGESKKVTFSLAIEQMAFYDREMCLSVEPGILEIMVGSSSEEIHLQEQVEITGSQNHKVLKRLFECPVSVE